MAGYDDALYAHIAKDIVKTGDWLNIRSNGYPALEHPPLLVWVQAALFSVFGLSDGLARLPSALAGFGTILLTYWLGRKLTGDDVFALAAMFVMAGSVYFHKYAARGMTDVPFTFLFLASICAWTRRHEHRGWYLLAGALAGLTQLTRGMMGVGLPIVFAFDLWREGRRPPVVWVFATAALVFLPIAAWYAHTIGANGSNFFAVHDQWLRNEVYGSLNPPWRRYTGAPEYLWMLTKSYWPWLPYLVGGMIFSLRRRDWRFYLPLTAIAVVFVLCSAARSRVLRYMLPAYPFFALLAATTLQRFVPMLRYALPALATGVVVFLIAAPVRTHAEHTRAIARIATQAAPENERLAFYDEGQPRFDETNQLQWYGDRYLVILLSADKLEEALRTPPTRTWIVDAKTYAERIEPQFPHDPIGTAGHLVCFRARW